MCVCVCVCVCARVCPCLGFPGSSDSEESACNVEDLGPIPELRRFPGEGNGYSLQYCLFNKWKIPHTGSPDPIDGRAQKGSSVR